jgi:hypothetical protein
MNEGSFLEGVRTDPVSYFSDRVKKPLQGTKQLTNQNKDRQAGENKNDSGLLLQGLRGCLWGKGTPVRYKDNPWAMPDTSRNLFKRDKD